MDEQRQGPQDLGRSRPQRPAHGPRGAGWRMRIEPLAQDLSHGLRALRASTSFTVVAVLTLALGIGATTAIFSVVSGVVLRPLPFREPERLVQLYGTPATRSKAVDHLAEYRAQSRSFETLVGYGVSARYLGGASGTERVMTVAAERGFFEMLGVAPIAGRTFDASDPPGVAVVAERFWRQRLDADPAALGRSLPLDGEPVTLIGIMPETFQFPYSAGSVLPGVAPHTSTDLWTPLDLPITRVSYVTGRLKAGVSVPAASQELELIARRLEAAAPDPYGPRGVRLMLLRDAAVGPAVRRPLVVLLGAVGFVLALACANVVNLRLVRLMRQRREIAVRMALGAGPARLVRQFLTESLLLSLGGGVGGVCVAWWGSRGLTRLAGAQIPRASEVGFDWRVLLCLAAACALAGIVSGLAPVLVALRTPPHTVLQTSSGSGSTSTGLGHLRAGLVVVEVALAFVLATGTTLLVRELVRLRDTDPGFSPTTVMTLHLGPRTRGGPATTDTDQFYDIAHRVTELPGVVAAGFIQVLPLQNWGWTANSSGFVVTREPAPAPAFLMELRYVTPGYFRALGVPMLAGRGFTAQDDGEGPRVILINDALARRYFGDEDPVGLDTNRGTIVGVVGNVRQVHLDRPFAPEVYHPIAQNWSQLPDLGMSLVVRTHGPPQPLIEPIRSVVRDSGPGQAIFDVKTMERILAESLSSFTTYLWLMMSFAVLALLLAAAGTYGVVAAVVASRTQELAIRLALGAGPRRVMRSVLGWGLRLTIIGVGLGTLGVFAATPLLRDLPVSVRQPDLTTVALVALLLASVTVAACLAPASRAARRDPLVGLRAG